MKNITSVSAIALIATLACGSLQFANAQSFGAGKTVMQAGVQIQTQYKDPSKICKARVEGHGFAGTRRNSLRYAMNNWVRHTTARYGSPFANWKNATGFATICRYDQIEQGYACMKAARPCSRGAVFTQ